MKRIYKITLLVGITILVSSCHNNSAPNYQYFPNMYESVAYEPYTEAKIFKGGKEGQLPVAGTINRGFEPYEYENSTAGYELAKANLKSPLDSLSKNIDKGKELFEIIQMDDRHTDVTVLHFEPLDQRNFADWSMALAGIEDKARFNLDGLLGSNLASVMVFFHLALTDLTDDRLEPY